MRSGHFGRCLVLGGRGFLGSHLVDALLSEGIAVRVFDRTVPYGLQARTPAANVSLLEFVEGDFANMKDLDAALEGCEICFHLINTTLPKSSNDDMVFDVESNLVGSLRLMRGAAAQGIRKIVFLSSGGTVYGVPQSLPIGEDHPTEPTSSYGVTKLATEKYLQIYSRLYGLKSVVLRLSNPFGERQRIDGAQGAIAVFLGAAIKGLPVDIWGDGLVVRDYIYVANVVDAVMRAMEFEGEQSLFNIGSGEGRSLLQVLDALERVLRRPIERRFHPGRNLDVPTNILDIDRARRVLGWSPAIGFDEGLERTVRSLLAQA